MKFTYEYRTSTNEKRHGVISASSRDAVYSLLKKDGIKPSRVELTPGITNVIVANRGKIVMLFALFATVVSLSLNLRTTNFKNEEVNRFDDVTRRQIIGDSFIVEKGIRTAWSDVFQNDGERFLASFAIPAAEAGLKSTTVEELEECLKRTILPAQSDGLEQRQIKAMVEGMKSELREFIKDGGTIAEYGKCLIERQEKEQEYYNRVKNELVTLISSGASDEEVEEAWELRNLKLRSMGIKPIQLSELTSSY